MAFNTMAFIIFFACVLLLYYIVPRKYRWIFLLGSSYFFYLYASAKFVIFIILTTITSYVGTLYIGKTHSQEKAIIEKKDLDAKGKKAEKKKLKQKRRYALIILLVLNFGILVFLKYFNFFAANLNVIFESISFTGKMPKLNLILPLGISFYTFQTMSYVIDVYWGKVEAEKNFGKVALFVSFFPQIIQGPIGRFKDLAPELFSQKKGNIHDVTFGVQLMMWGFFKKMVIADRVGIIVDYVFGHYLNISGFGVTFGVVMYAIQDYTDFSGCIDIARGCAKAMGIEMAENFKRPYFSRTIPEFWRRWHMSLGAWMKDYVFYPFSLTKRVRILGKSTKKRFGKFVGLTLPVALGNILVFFLVGVWHGASWNYIIWGLFYGVLIAGAAFLKPVFDWMVKKLHINIGSKLFILFQIARTFWITCIGCIIFRADGLKNTMAILSKFFQSFEIPEHFMKELMTFGLDYMNYVALFLCLFILFVVDVMQEKMVVREWIEKRNVFIRLSIYIIGFLLIFTLGVYGPGITANQFVYMQF
ncbi:MAG: MBOAT family O-acyltransferase [Longicatena sp.]